MMIEMDTELPVREVPIDRDRIARYAQASGDLNPIHLDDEFARSVGLPGVIAHGMLQMGLLAQYLTEWVGDRRRVRRLRCRFAGMVIPGDVLTFGGRVVSTSEEVATLEIWAQNQKGERILSKGEADVVLQ